MKKLHLMGAACSCLLALFTTSAHALAITPGDCDDFGGSIECYTGNDPSNSELTAFIEGTFGVTELYKENAPDTNDEAGLFASFYDTAFANSATDPEDATITYTGGDFILCGDCFLVVKDGKNSPAWYVFNISELWDGMDTIYLTDFWIGSGAISHVAIFGNEVAVPEPSTFALLSLGLAALGFTRRKMKA